MADLATGKAAMIEHRRLDTATELLWALPSSGYAHVADDQPLPYIQKKR